MPAASVPAAEDLIARFDLRPHPEGGRYRETYRSPGVIGGRSQSTAMLFLLPKGERSRLHRLRSDEVWHFHDGGPLIVVELAPDGRVGETTLGRDFAQGQRPQHVVPAGSWFGAYPAAQTDHSLVGCTLAPGFDFADLELGRRAELLKLFPHAKELIEKLTD
ncbi:MAG: cupin domain-containing protein [Elusimicrobia bacterium]|nr:cupin domain-containing protein [Elusimicrobiota bacterium]